MNSFMYNYSTNMCSLPPIYQALYTEYDMMDKTGTVPILLCNLVRELENMQVNKKRINTLIYSGQV